MRRALLIVLGSVLLLAACGGGQTVAPVPETVVGSVQQGPTGSTASGQTLFASQGCGSCHTYAPAGAAGKIGPNLDDVEADAKKADQGTVEEYVHTSIVSPDSYIAPGFPKGVMPAFTSLSDEQVADLVAFVTQKS
jgi:mono/diheme cytochrome c family protein